MPIPMNQDLDFLLNQTLFVLDLFACVSVS